MDDDIDVGDDDSSRTRGSRPRLPGIQERAQGRFDTIVIGSGISGLATAATLTMTGDRVLVLEQHDRPGGFTHVFRRRGFEWDVGIHYIGTVHEKADWYLQLAALTDGALRFEPMGDPVDRIRFPGLTVDMPGDYEAYKQVLAQSFPAEKDGIGAYLDKIRDTRTRLRGYFASSVPPRPLTRMARAVLVRTAHEAATTTTDAMMSRYLRDERLKDVLDAQWGNIGMPRRRCAFIVHAAMLGYYLESPPTFPVGGSSIFARYLGRTIEGGGSVIRLRALVERIMVDRGRVVGVRMRDGEEIASRRVVSSAGLINTYTKLLEPEKRIASITARVEALPRAYEYMNLFFGLDTCPAALGLGRENHWIYREWDTSDRIFWDVEDPEVEGAPKIIFINSSSMKDPEFGQHGNVGHTGQVVFIGKQGAFHPWANTRWRKRGDDYEDIKRRVADTLIAAIDRHFPGLASHVVHREVATSLTYSHFSAHAGGVPFGLAPIPARYRSLDMRPATPIRGLFLCGQDLIMPGVSAAFGSAMMCSSLIRRRDMGGWLRKRGRTVLGL